MKTTWQKHQTLNFQIVWIEPAVQKIIESIMNLIYQAQTSLYEKRNKNNIIRVSEKIKSQQFLVNSCGAKSNVSDPDILNMKVRYNFSSHYFKILDLLCITSQVPLFDTSP